MSISSSTAVRRAATRLVASLALACGVACGGAAAIPAVATAGTYAVYLCQKGYGTGAFSAWTGWPAEFAQSQNCTQPPPPYGRDMVQGPLSGPGKGDGLSVWSSGRAASAGDFEYWSLTAPVGTEITSLSYSGAFAAWGGWTSQWQAYSGSSYTNIGDPTNGGDCSISACNAYATGTSAITVPVINASRIGFGIFCHAALCPVNSGSSMFGPAGKHQPVQRCGPDHRPAARRSPSTHLRRCGSATATPPTTAGL